MRLFYLAFLFLPFSSFADFSDCQSLYISTIAITKENGLSSARFVENIDDEKASFWVGFSTWEPNARRDALILLLDAKESRKAVDIFTNGEGNCEITSPGREFVGLRLSK